MQTMNTAEAGTSVSLPEYYMEPLFLPLLQLRWLVYKVTYFAEGHTMSHLIKTALPGSQSFALLISTHNVIKCWNIPRRESCLDHFLCSSLPQTSILVLGSFPAERRDAK